MCMVHAFMFLWCVCVRAFVPPLGVPLTVVCVLQSRSRPLTSGHRDRSNIWSYETAVGTGKKAKFKAAPRRYLSAGM